MRSFQARVKEASNTNDVVLPHEENHGINMRRPKQVSGFEKSLVAPWALHARGITQQRS